MKKRHSEDWTPVPIHVNEQPESFGPQLRTCGKNMLPAAPQSAPGGSTTVLLLLTRDIHDPSLLIYM